MRSLTTDPGLADSPSMRWRTLDGARGLAIILVVVYHAYPSVAPMGGPTGVSLFFVLSGFLITNLLFRELDATGTIGLKRFYMRRMRRLAPALLVYVLFSVAVFGWDISWQPLLYVGNYSQANGFVLLENAHTWSLAVEEHFYLVWPLALITFSALRRWKVLAVVVGILVSWRLLVPSPDWAYVATDTNAYALGLGGLLAGLKDRWKPPVWMLWLSVGSLVALSAYPSSDLADFRWTAIVASALSGVLVLSAIHHRSRFLEGRIMTGVGRISYALYLWHVALISVTDWFLGSGYEWLAIFVSVVVATLSWYLIERPILTPAIRVGDTPATVIRSGGQVVDPRMLTGRALFHAGTINEKKPSRSP